MVLIPAQDYTDYESTLTSAYFLPEIGEHGAFIITFKYFTSYDGRMNTRLYIFVDLIRGLYWLLWIAVDVFVLFQVYYYYPYLATGLAMLALFLISTYFEYKFYGKLTAKLAKRLQ